jgi:protein phosphatase
VSRDGVEGATASRVVLRAGAATHTGLVRSVNQDRLVAIDGRLYGVADGMGGHRAGEVAAEITATRLAADARAADALDAGWLRRSIEAANDDVFARSQHDGSVAGMGTTITAMALSESARDPMVAVANVGDSRTYRMRSGDLELLTEDHNVVAELVRDGTITEEQAKVHPRRSVMTRAVGVEPAVEIDLLEVLLAVGDRFLLCSDGLHGFVAEPRIAGALRRLADPEEAAHELVQLALAAGAPDNVSVVVVDVLADGDAALLASRSLESNVRAASAPSAPRDGPSADAAGPPAPAPRPGPARRSRTVTVRVAVFLAALTAVGAVALWAIRTGSSSTEPSTVPPTVGSTVDPFADEPAVTGSEQPTPTPTTAGSAATSSSPEPITTTPPTPAASAPDPVVSTAGTG